MKPIISPSHILLFILLTGSLCLSSCHTSRTVTSAPEVKTDEPRFTLIIMYDASIGKEPLMKAVKAYQATLLYDYKNFNGIAISIPTSREETNAIRHFKSVKGVLSVQKDRKMQLYD